MIPTQTFDNFPEFANAGTKTKPNDAKYAQGFLPSDVLPAEWLNYFLAGSTKGVTALNTGAASVEAEINTVLASRNVDPDASSTNQLLTALNRIKAEAILAAHPVGSLYWTSSNENPAITFGGGTWVQIKDRFVLACGDTYKTVGATDGASSVTLSVSNMPSHNHSFTPSGTVSSHSHGLNNHTHSFTPSGTVSSHSHGLNNHTHSFTPSGTVSSTFSGSATTTTGNGEHSHLMACTSSSPGSGTSANYLNFKFRETVGNANSTANSSYSNGTVFSLPYSNNSNIVSCIGGGVDTRKTDFFTLGALVTLSGYHNHSFTPSGTVSSSLSGSTGTTGKASGNTESATPTFTGNAGTTGQASGSTANATPTFTGNAGNTGSNGSGTSFSILPPYVVKYCWERTA